jgi:predicted enzyme related to lactoylglutathione lyase
MPKVAHFEIVTKDIPVVKKFYEDVFGWKFNQWGSEEYWLISTGEENEKGIDGGFVKSRGENVIVNTINVPNLDEYIQKVENNGGKITVPKNAVPGIGWLCYFKDVEGNLFGMIQNDPQAK